MLLGMPSKLGKQLRLLLQTPGHEVLLTVSDLSHATYTVAHQVQLMRVPKDNAQAWGSNCKSEIESGRHGTIFRRTCHITLCCTCSLYMLQLGAAKVQGLCLCRPAGTTGNAVG